LDFERGTSATFIEFKENGGLEALRAWYGVPIWQIQSIDRDESGKVKTLEFSILSDGYYSATPKKMRESINSFCLFTDSDWKIQTVDGRYFAYASNEKCKFASLMESGLSPYFIKISKVKI
jgi:hypothetical protein